MNQPIRSIAKFVATTFALALVAVSLSACGRQETPPPVASEPPRALQPLPDAARAKLATADAADGEVDQVVSKCVICQLAMNGKAAHAATVEGYSVHLCSAACQTVFEKDPAAALLAVTAMEK